ncbi:MAG TPA: malto-oligosyltrehalose synthase [Streptosporangiaceae bacterium]|nr:malto-oligosyltrehalose synthase [Streptosporangiaceae bacterium]
MPRPARPWPGSTYRLQLRPEFGFARAAELAGYLSALGVTHVYLSPVLQAARGSAHGYDVVDHSRISDELGGEAGFRAMAATFRGHSLGIVADIVPNHMGIGPPQSQNRPFWSVLRDGRESPSAHWFDIDWAARGGRLLLPILAGPPEGCLADLTVDPGGDRAWPQDGPVLRYFEHVLPLRGGTAELPLPELLAAQHYELASWRTAAAELNWRRFFDVTTLIGVQVQEEDVFAATHGLMLGLVAEGLVEGLRVDHPDGLAEPRRYLEQLATATSGAWVVAEKILAGDEQLPADWDCAGTTGYDSLAIVGGLFADPAGGPALTRDYIRLTGGPAAFAPVAAAARREVAGGLLAAEVSRLARLAARCGHPELDRLSDADLRAILTELVSAVPVYRAYVVPGEPAPATAVARLADAERQAHARLPARLAPALATLTALLLDPASAGPPASSEAAARAQLAVRFQQTCGPVMAKGVEDTAFYRWSRLTSLNEVGGEPARLGASPAEFHAFAARLARDWPATMTTLSTHDTKRGEDIRARLAVLAERPAEWAAEVTAWHDRAAALSAAQFGDVRLPEPDTEYLLWQTLTGGWPVEPGRLTEYLRKAMREAKTATSWADPDEDYEAAVLGLAKAVLADTVPDASPASGQPAAGEGGLAGRIARFVARIEPDARVNSLGAKLVQLTMPGVPDVYQGGELGDFALVDPDNRRPVDFDRRRDLLSGLDGPLTGEPPSADRPAGPGALLDWHKLLVTSRALRLRRDHPGWFAGSYDPLGAAGPAAGHAVAFVRGGHAVTVVTRLPGGLRQRGGWAGTELVLPEAPFRPSGFAAAEAGPAGPAHAWRDVLTGAVHDGPRVRLAQLLARLPVALLVPAAEAG